MSNKDDLNSSISHIITAIEFLRRLPRNDEILEHIRKLEDIRQDLNTMKVREELNNV